MSRLTISLFGRFSAVRSEKEVEGLEAQKVQELLCYLLIHRDRPHGREKLADLLWPTSSCTQSKQYLRQTLCQLQAALATNEVADNALIVVESDWIQINTDAAYTLDLCQFEQAFALSQRQQGHELDAAQARQLEAAVQLYCGDLLENWYQDWCIVERERVQNLYLFMVGKLMGYCTARQHYERGILYGSDILRCDVAHEPTYRRLMRLHALAGNRTGALRQYERCVTVLEQELGVQPTEPTVALYNQIRDGRSVASVMPEPPTHGQMPSSLSLTGLLERLTYVKMDLSRAQSQVEEDIELVKTALRGQG